MDTRGRLAAAVALPGLLLAVAGFFHPHRLDHGSSGTWFGLHLAALLVFPLVGLALAAVVRGRRDPLSWLVRLTAYGYATFYSALDVISGVAAGYVTRELGPGVARPDEVRLLFGIGSPLGEIGSWCLVACCATIALDLLLRRRLASVLAALALVAGAWLVHVDHIFAPAGALGMALVGVATGVVVWREAVSDIPHVHPVTRR